MRDGVALAYVIAFFIGGPLCAIASVLFAWRAIAAAERSGYVIAAGRSGQWRSNALVATILAGLAVAFVWAAIMLAVC